MWELTTLFAPVVLSTFCFILTKNLFSCTNQCSFDVYFIRLNRSMYYLFWLSYTWIEIISYNFIKQTLGWKIKIQWKCCSRFCGYLKWFHRLYTCGQCLIRKHHNGYDVMTRNVEFDISWVECMTKSYTNKTNVTTFLKWIR